MFEPSATYIAEYARDHNVCYIQRGCWTVFPRAYSVVAPFIGKQHDFAACLHSPPLRLWSMIVIIALETWTAKFLLLNFFKDLVIFTVLRWFVINVQHNHHQMKWMMGSWIDVFMIPLNRIMHYQ